jgi:proline iminopeptidase
MTVVMLHGSGPMDRNELLANRHSLGWAAAEPVDERYRNSLPFVVCLPKERPVKDILDTATPPHAEGMLDIGDGNHMYWATYGNPSGKPAAVVHGGPGSGSNPDSVRLFDLSRYRVVLFDQRGCGASKPHASDPATDMRVNTTAHLIADMERLREHLQIDRWLLLGGSWGSTLILAYAELHPKRVSEVVLNGVTTTRRIEIDWLYNGVARFFPEAWERFCAGVPEADRQGNLVAAYAHLMNSSDASVTAKAAANWCAWEDAVLSCEPHGAAAPYGDRPPQARIAFVRIAAHYFAHAAWLEEAVLLREAHRLTGIPGVLLHGRHDMAGPPDTAWYLARAWPDARLSFVADAGHKGSSVMRELTVAALDGFAS